MRHQIKKCPICRTKKYNKRMFIQFQHYSACPECFRKQTDPEEYIRRLNNIKEKLKPLPDHLYPHEKIRLFESLI